ncbi:MAG: VacJ family lipoprotein [Deltaproteobacteria bacterium]|nr:VacJ family lipoprotein [Deltaproteobacteria bacterium]
MTPRLRYRITAPWLAALAWLAPAMVAGFALPAPAAAQATIPEAADAATGESAAPETVGDDPWEPFNRPIFAFNEGLDRWLIKPVAQGWDTVMPRPVQVSIDNFFDNLRFPARFVNDLLQGELDPAAVTLCRFVVNTTAGLGGFIDWGSGMGLPRHSADFGQTLGRWGVPPGPYLVWPVFGSSNPRDTVGIAADSYLDISALFGDLATLATARVVQTVNTRSLLLDEVDAARDASFDFYVAVRTAYIERRQRLIRGMSDSERGDDELYFPDYSDQEVLP